MRKTENLELNLPEPDDFFDVSHQNENFETIDEELNNKAEKDGTNATGTWNINITGNAKTATKATSADSATKATQDASGNVITDTYAEKETIALKSATGASISIADSKEAPMILNYAPVNLFSHSFSTTTINGITFTANADGTITANGTATAYTEVIIGKYTFTKNDIGKTFSWSDNGAIKPVDWGAYIFMNFVNGDNIWRQPYTFIVEKAHTAEIRIYVASGKVVEDIIYRPMLEEGSTYLTYDPYTGYDITSCGKNLIGSVPKSTSGTRCTASWVGDDVTVTSTVSGAWIGYSCNTRGLKPNTKYTVSIEVEASTTNIYNGIKFGNKMKFGYGLSGTVTLTDTTDANGYIYLLFLVDNKLGGSSGDYAIFKNIMLEEGDTASGYEASKSTSVTINSETVFPVNGLESYDGLTNVLNPYSATMEVTYATNEAGQGILKEIETIEDTLAYKIAKLSNVETYDIADFFEKSADITGFELTGTLQILGEKIVKIDLHFKNYSSTRAEGQFTIGTLKKGLPLNEIERISAWTYNSKNSGIFLYNTGKMTLCLGKVMTMQEVIDFTGTYII